MNPDVLEPRVLPPASFEAWARTCKDFAAAINSGPGLVCFVGPKGCGKTYTLQLYKASVTGRRVGYRSPSDQPAADTEIDLVDDVSATSVESLISIPPGGTVRVLAVAPELAADITRLRPDARLIRVHPMQEADARVMIQERCNHFGLKQWEFPEDAVAELILLNDGTPRRLDRLFGLAVRHAISISATAVSPEDVRVANMLTRPQEPLPQNAKSTNKADLVSNVDSRTLELKQPPVDHMKPFASLDSQTGVQPEKDEVTTGSVHSLSSDLTTPRTFDTGEDSNRTAPKLEVAKREFLASYPAATRLGRRGNLNATQQRRLVSSKRDGMSLAAVMCVCVVFAGSAIFWAKNMPQSTPFATAARINLNRMMEARMLFAFPKPTESFAPPSGNIEAM